jgi:hypothetical protein
MVTKIVLFAVLAACGVPSTPATAGPAESPDDFKPTEPDVKPIESHWCCHSVDPKTMSGEGCTAFSGSVETINACAQYLHCSSGAAKVDGKVTCE